MTTDSSDDAFSSERMADRARIAQALHLYCRAIDRLAVDDLALVFHADASIDNGHFKGTLAAFSEDVRGRHGLIPQSSHMIVNVLVDFLAPDRAFVESYGLALEQHPQPRLGEGPAHRIVRVRYADLFERRAGAWKVASRTVVIDHEMLVPQSACATPLAPPERYRGTRTAGDPIAVQRRALGL